MVSPYTSSVFMTPMLGKANSSPENRNQTTQQENNK
jgi:hypothetical protein